MAITAQLIERIKGFEGNFDFMYQDSTGHVTVGIGYLLATAHAAVLLPFLKAGTANPASADEKSAEWSTIKKKPGGHKESYYKPFTKLALKQEVIDGLLSNELIDAENQVRTAFPDYDKYPQGVQEALVDMVFNLGLSGVVDNFPTFTKAVKARDWTTAAKECHRLDIQDERNDATRDLFLQAAAAARPANPI